MRDSDKQLSHLGFEGSVSLVSGFFFFSSAFVCCLSCFSLDVTVGSIRGRKCRVMNAGGHYFCVPFFSFRTRGKHVLKWSVCWWVSLLAFQREGNDAGKSRPAARFWKSGGPLPVHSARLQLIKLKTGSGICVWNWPSPGEETASSSGLGCSHTRKRAVTFGHRI